MSFTIQKSLGNTFFRFAVARRREFRSIDSNPELSTGPSGEFVRHRPEIFYVADLRSIRTPEVPAPRSIAGVSFWASMFDGTRRGWAMVGMVVFGLLITLMGCAVARNNAAPGIFEMILGLLLVGTPLFLTFQKRRHIRAEEQRARHEREERDKRNAELLSAYTSALEKLRENPSDEHLDLVMRENEKLDMPYAVWADTAIATVLYVGFSTLARLGPERASEVAQLMDRSSDAAGLIAEDALAVKHALYSSVLWHFLADDRLGQEQLKIVRAVQEGFGIKSEDVPQDTSAEAQFERLRGVDHRNAPRCEASVPLHLNEYCMYTAQIRTGDNEATPITITNKRVVVGSDKKMDVQVKHIDDLFVDADRNRVVVRASELKRPLDFHADEPIYLTAMLDLATRLDDRPKSFA